MPQDRQALPASRRVAGSDHVIRLSEYRFAAGKSVLAAGLILVAGADAQQEFRPCGVSI